MIAAVLSQHAEGAAMLWVQRAAAVGAPHFSLKDLAKLDGRLEAHIDGLRIAGADGWETCLEQLAFEEPGEVFTAAVLAFESGDAARIEKVVSIAENVPETVPGLVSAVAWLDEARARPRVTGWLAADSAFLRFLGVSVAGILRIDPGLRLLDLLRDPDARIRARTAKAIGELGRADLVTHLARALDDPEQRVRVRAAGALALFSADSSAAVSELRQAVENGPAKLPQAALPLALRRMDRAATRTWQKSLAVRPETRRAAIQAAGLLGDPESMPWIIDQMKVPELARLAGEAFTFITGAGIDYRDLDGPVPEGFEAGPTENPEDENVDLDPDEDLAWPDANKVADWWQKNRGGFAVGTRHLCGKPLSADWLKTVLRDGFQRQRAVAALETAMLQPGGRLFNVAAPGFVQIRFLGRPAEPLR